jgi:hypothetical protein
MSFGYSVGDFLAVAALAWSLYKDCSSAPESFQNVAQEVLSLYAVLKEAEESVFKYPLSLERQTRLKVVGDGCEKILLDLQTLVTKYHSLGTNRKRTWDRLRWHSNDIAELRTRLTSNIGLLTAFIVYVVQCPGI